MTTSTPIQVSLAIPELLGPLPRSPGHYVAVVQSKIGEREALHHASPSTWQRLTPLVAVVGPKKPTKLLSEASVAAWIRKLGHAIGTRPFYLDILRLNPELPVAGTQGTTDPVLARMYAEARKRRLQVVPVAHAGESGAGHLRMVADAVLADGRGAALRYRMRKVIPPPGASHRDVLQAQLDALAIRAEDADLIVDLGYLDEDDEVHADDVASALNAMCTVGDWRCLVVVGTSMPKMMSCVKEGTLGSIPRREWTLWSALANCRLERMPAFGDYAIQHPEPPLDDGGGNTMRANIRYTAASETLVARGHGPVSQEGNEQYRDLCQRLTARPEFAGPDYSWGDSVIDECSRGLREPGSQNVWRGAGTSHHLQFVTDTVRGLHEGSPDESGTSPGTDRA